MSLQLHLVACSGLDRKVAVVSSDPSSLLDAVTCSFLSVILTLERGVHEEDHLDVEPAEPCRRKVA